MKINSFASALAYLKGKADRPLDGRSTRLVHLLDNDEETIVVRYHNTNVITYRPDGSVEYESGGWRTLTTKDRMNAYGAEGWKIWSVKGVWKIGTVDRAVEFVDGIIVRASDNLTFPKGYDRTGMSAEDANKRVTKMIGKFLKGWAAQVKDDRRLASPGPGDCFGCLFHDASVNFQAEWRDPLTAREPMGYDHYLEHFEGGYYVPSMLWRACQRYGGPSYVWAMMEGEAERGDFSFARRALQSFFTRIKPKLVAELQARYRSNEEWKSVTAGEIATHVS